MDKKIYGSRIHKVNARDVAYVQALPLLSENQRRGVCDSPVVIVYGGHVGVSWNMWKMI